MEQTLRGDMHGVRVTRVVTKRYRILSQIALQQLELYADFARNAVITTSPKSN